MGVICRSRNACNNELNWASDGATANGLGQTINRIQINERLLCTVLADADDIYIRDRSCHEERYFACQYACRTSMCADNDDPILSLQGYVYSSQAGRYYRPYKEELNFWDAQAR